MISEGAKEIAARVRELCTCKVQWRPLAIIFATPYRLHERWCYYAVRDNKEVVLTEDEKVRRLPVQED